MTAVAFERRTRARRGRVCICVCVSEGATYRAFYVKRSKVKRKWNVTLTRQRPTSNTCATNDQSQIGVGVSFRFCCISCLSLGVSSSFVRCAPQHLTRVGYICRDYNNNTHLIHTYTYHVHVYVSIRVKNNARTLHSFSIHHHGAGGGGGGD